MCSPDSGCHMIKSIALRKHKTAYGRNTRRGLLEHVQDEEAWKLQLGDEGNFDFYIYEEKIE